MKPFEVGEIVPLRNGETVKIICVDRVGTENTVRPIIVQHPKGFISTCTETGRHLGEDDHPYDLIPPQ